MSYCFTGVSEDLQEEFQSSMLHDNMNIYCLMLYARRVEEARSNRKSRDAKRDRSFDEAPQIIGLIYKISLNL